MTSSEASALREVPGRIMTWWLGELRGMLPKRLTRSLTTTKPHLLFRMDKEAHDPCPLVAERR